MLPCTLWYGRFRTRGTVKRTLVEHSTTKVVHGTYYDAWESIKKTGLNKMGRTHIHFAKGEYGSAEVISGMHTAVHWTTSE